MSNRPLDSLSATETLEIENGLSLVPRLRLELNLFPASPSVTKPIDQWKLKRTLIEFLNTSLSVVVPEDDLLLRRVRDLKTRRRDDPLAVGTLFLRDLGFLRSDESDLGRKLHLWRTGVVQKLDGIELNIEGFKFKLNVSVPVSDDFEEMERDWDGFFASRNRGYSKREPDTIVLRGLPSRWFAEPRVSSKPSLLVTHTVFSTLGKIRNINVAEDDYLGKDASDDGVEIISGLHCKILVQFETHKDFYNTLKVLCGRSMQKQGSRLWADYDVSWDKGDFFGNTPSQTREKVGMREMGQPQYRSEARSRQQRISRVSPDDVRRKRFKE